MTRLGVWRAVIVLALIAAPCCSPGPTDGERAAALTPTTTTTLSEPVDPTTTSSTTTAPTETSTVTNPLPPSTSTNATNTTNPATPISTTEALVDTAVVISMLAELRVEAEPPRVGYARELFPQWRDTNGSGCHARQDVLAAQVIGLAQVDLFDWCVIVEGDWW